jgi:hypothetical protein
MDFNIIEKHEIREFSMILNDNGVILCDKNMGAFIVLRHSEDIVNLRKLLDTIEITKLPSGSGND